MGKEERKGRGRGEGKEEREIGEEGKRISDRC